MTRDEIIKLAREADTGPERFSFPVEFLERFAALVAAEEREACAISCEVNAARWINAGGKQWYAAHECASAIRAMGQS